MQNVPKIVVKRLQSPAAESHPDADQLTAFAEQSLAGHERDQIMQHLARCGDCREVVSLAHPPEVELPVHAGSRANWFRWPVLRWAAVAAGVVLIASIATVQYRNRSAKQLASSVFYQKPVITAREERAIAAPAQSSQLSPQAAAPQTRMRNDKLPAARAQAALADNKLAPPAGAAFNARAGSAGGIGGGSAGGVLGGVVHGLNLAPRRDSAIAPAPPSPAPAATAKQIPTPGPAQPVVVVPSASQVVEVQSEAAQIPTQTTTQNQTRDQLVSNERAEQSQASADQYAAVVRAKPTSPEPSLHTAPAPSLRADAGLMKSQGVPRWTIGATGALQRSLDGGKTWLDVNVAVDQSMGANFVSGSQTEVVTTEAQAQTRTVTKTDASKAKSNGAPAAKSGDAGPVSSASTIFRALSVSSNAAEIWAGGSGGALYHTLDSGNRWSRVVPSAAGIVLTGDIISIQFTDPRNGTVTTSNAEVWTTVDDGQTWHKQP
jgi:hypothetical protein